jgi:hypothetical protein
MSTQPLTPTPNDMYRYGYASGQDDAAAGTYSAPIPAEDGADYSNGYRAGHADGTDAIRYYATLARA